MQILSRLAGRSDGFWLLEIVDCFCWEYVNKEFRKARSEPLVVSCWWPEACSINCGWCSELLGIGNIIVCFWSVQYWTGLMLLLMSVWLQVFWHAQINWCIFKKLNIWDVDTIPCKCISNLDMAMVPAKNNKQVIQKALKFLCVLGALIDASFLFRIMPVGCDYNKVPLMWFVV